MSRLPLQSALQNTPELFIQSVRPLIGAGDGVDGAADPSVQGELWEPASGKVFDMDVSLLHVSSLHKREPTWDVELLSQADSFDFGTKCPYLPRQKAEKWRGFIPKFPKDIFSWWQDPF